MHIERLTITNQKSFFGSTEFHFQPGFNILLGANSSGKTTVLEALDFAVGLTPHRSMLSHATVGLVTTISAEVATRFELSANELTLFSARADDYVGNTFEDGRSIETTDKQIISKFLNLPLQFEVVRNSTTGDRLRLHLWNEPCAWQRQSASAEHNCALIKRTTEVAPLVETVSGRC